MILRLLTGAFAAVFSLVASATLAAQISVAEAYSTGFDQCLEVLRTQEISGFRRVPEAESDFATLLQPYAVRDLTGMDALVLLYNDTSESLDSPEMQSCTIWMRGIAGVGTRTALNNWAERLQAALSGFDGVSEFAPRHGSPLPRYGWCEDGERPFLVALGAEVPGRPISVAVTNYVSFSDPNPCEQE